MKLILTFALLLSVVSLSMGATPKALVDLLDQVAGLGISRNGYTLGRILTDTQKGTARRHPVKIENPHLYKFKDGELVIVVEKTTHRVIIMYEQHDAVSQEEIREFVGALFLDYGEPTVFTHNKIIYWAWGQDGKYSKQAFKKAKEAKQPLNILATVKLNSSIEIMGAGETKNPGSVYYIIASDPALKMIQTR